MIKVYLASPWFNSAQKETMDKVRNILIDMDFEVFAPFYDGIVLDKMNDSPEMRQQVFDIDVDSVADADLVVAVIDDRDSGTIFEAGIAYGREIPIIMYSDSSLVGINAILQKGAMGFAFGEEQLREQLRRFKAKEQLADYLGWKMGDFV